MPRSRPARLVVGLGLTAVVVLGDPVGARAAGPLVPGSQWSTTVDLPDSWAGQADRLGVAVTSLDQQENGCLRPEVDAGDTTCDAGGGDLADLVSASVAAGRYADGRCTSISEARPLALIGGDIARVDVAGPECLVLTIDFPEGPDDDLGQSDALALSLSLVASGPGAVVTPGVPPAVVATEGQAGSSSSDQQPEVAERPGGTAGGGAPAVGGGPGTAGDSPAAVVERPGVRFPSTPVGEATAEVAVGADGTSVEAEAAERLLEDPFALGALLLGATVLLWVLFLLVRRRRGERA